jgi:hypothetical protein
LVVAECGTGKTLISLGAIHVHSEGSPFTALAMVPPHLVEKWAREAFLTLPGIRVFMIDDLRNGGDENKHHGVNEARFREGRIVRQGLNTTLSEMRLRRGSASSRKRWLSLCGKPSLFYQACRRRRNYARQVQLVRQQVAAIGHGGGEGDFHISVIDSSSDAARNVTE